MARRRGSRFGKFCLRAFFSWVIVAIVMAVVALNMHFQVSADGQMSPQDENGLIVLLFAMVPATFLLMFVVRRISHTSRRREER